ncbi:hypothetical protein [Streptomyces sp. NPDC090021]|uniref:hypothetical protein n=1 Tax=Streptomyces sp. NPDC090021 TaxID=3365919 RepID=UPI00381EC3FA
MPEKPVDENPAGFVGVDLQIVNIATASTGYRAAGRGLNRHRERQLALEKKLQSKGTKSAGRLLKKRSCKEARHTANVSHIISKYIVTTAERTGSGIALEDLTGILDSRALPRKRERFPATLRAATLRGVWRSVPGSFPPGWGLLARPPISDRIGSHSDPQAFTSLGHPVRAGTSSGVWAAARMRRPS